MLTVPRALLVQQLYKLGATQSSAFGDWKAAMPTATEAPPGNSRWLVLVLRNLLLAFHLQCIRAVLHICAKQVYIVHLLTYLLSYFFTVLREFCLASLTLLLMYRVLNKVICLVLYITSKSNVQ